MNPHWKYLKYVVKHKFFVFKAGLQTKAPLWRLLIHDWTKFLPCEWIPYAENFYGRPRFREKVYIVVDNSGSEATVINTSDSSGCEYAVETSSGEAIWVFRKEITRTSIKGAFDRAWLHHQHANPHHWQHWCLQDDSPVEPSGKPKVLKMPEHFAREMVADWMGAGRAITGAWDIKPWYVRNVTNIKLHPETRAFVEDLIFGADHGLIGSSSTSTGATAGITA